MGKRKGFVAIVLFIGMLAVITAVFILAKQAEAPTIAVNQYITITAPLADALITSPVLVSGTVRAGWTAFEGQVGTVLVRDEDGTELGTGILAATSDWLRSPVSFEVSVSFSAPKGEEGTLEFESENPSGDPARVQTFTLPVRFER